ncbi:MAG TPA: hypothetical protein VE987_17335, partial [Polyangiaceae bacterium]|nr:hypothetical protein [Polyangiaceae bacterium]
MTDAAAGRPRAWLAFFWVASSAGIGSLAGLPWLWFVSGPLPAAVFASFAAAESWRLWRAPSASLENVRASALWGVGAALVAFVFANPTGHTWLDRCFDVWNGSEDVTMSWRLAVAGGASVVFCAIALGLGALAQRLRAASSDGSAQAIDGALSRCAAWLAASAA